MTNIKKYTHTNSNYRFYELDDKVWLYSEVNNPTSKEMSSQSEHIRDSTSLLLAVIIYRLSLIV